MRKPTDTAMLNWLEKQAKNYRHPADLIASEAPAVKPDWKFYANRSVGATLREAIQKAMEKE